MKQLADGVWHIKCLPALPWAVNALAPATRSTG